MEEENKEILENENCVLLKKKEYDDLIRRANNNTPSFTIDLNIMYKKDSYYLTPYSIRNDIKTTIDLTEPIRKQIQNIIDLFNKSLDRKIDKLVEYQNKRIEEGAQKLFNKKKYEIEQQIDDIKRIAFNEVANMSFFERKEFLKQYKNK